jgi:hypothetical protein
MLCPCCGSELELDVVKCNCGARFVGAPLDEKPVHIKSYGHVMNTFGLLAVVIMAALVFTKFFAIGAIPVIWYTWRSLKLSRNHPKQYGGYKVLVPTFALSLVASSIVAGLTISYIPKFLQNREDRRKAAAMAPIHHQAALLEEYKLAKGTYPGTEQELREFTKEPMPVDYWGHSLKYNPYILEIATAVPAGNSRTKGAAQTQGMAGFYNFELRSNGPDELPNTEDDIIMKDGVIYTAAELKHQPTVKASAK